MKKILFSLIVALNCISFAKSASPADTEVENIKTYLNQLFESSKKVNSTSEEKEKARKTIDSSIDWDSIATLCLGPEHAKKYAGKNFGDFRNLLREVISKTAYSRMDKFWEGGTRAI
ncbi:MAG: hypothetical protein EBZ49_18710, partial [Proteobacteria bacterium]|nr:hypothetical protein [Pseudomonadota bacterium]